MTYIYSVDSLKTLNINLNPFNYTKQKNLNKKKEQHISHIETIKIKERMIK